jgi:hypothetical protein
MLEPKTEKGQQLVIESLRPREIADAEDEMVNSDDTRHDVSSRNALA